jgi:dihydrolipoamide dehydrogenase
MSDFDVVIVGSGPGGYVAAIRAGQLGMRTAIVERDVLGGVCLNWGCIPSKALLRNAEVLSLFHRADKYGITVGEITADYNQAMERSRKVVERLTKGVGSLLKKNNVEVVQGSAKLTAARTVSVDGQELSATNVILSTGARPRTLPGLDVDGKLVMTYREAIVANTVPEKAVIIGGGAIGVEFAYVYNAYGTDVTIVERESQLLPLGDTEISVALAKSLEKQGIHIYTSAEFAGLERSAAGSGTVKMKTGDGDKELAADRVLVAVGIQGNVEDLGLEEAGITVERSFVTVDDELRTAGDGVYAIGDMNGIMPLAHVAQAQGVYVVERIAGEETLPLDYQSMPSAVYCNPQVASIGLTEQQAKEQGLNYKVGKFPLIANGKALALNEYEGMAKLVIDAGTGEILGGHLVGPEVTEMLGELSLARVLEGTNLEIGAMVNAHPTVSEIIKEAALAADGKAIHI